MCHVNRCIIDRRVDLSPASISISLGLASPAREFGQTPSFSSESATRASIPRSFDVQKAIGDNEAKLAPPLSAYIIPHIIMLRAPLTHEAVGRDRISRFVRFHSATIRSSSLIVTWREKGAEGRRFGLGVASWISAIAIVSYSEEKSL